MRLGTVLAVLATRSTSSRASSVSLLRLGAVLAGLAVVGVSGCRAEFDPTRGREYPCRRDAGAAACPQGWACGLEERCHAPAAGPWRCDRDAGDGDCFGWACGLEGSCHPRDGGPWLCQLDAGNAACFGWACGLEGSCHPPDAGPWLCRLSAGDTDCLGWACGVEGRCRAREAGPWLCRPDAGDADCLGWHCGLEDRCYSVEADAGAARQCSYAAEQDGGRRDCANGWRCGREQVCHRVGEVQPWLCGSDLDCEGGWRCEAGGRCINPAAEALPATGPRRAVCERVSPRRLDRRPDALSIFVGSGSTQTGAWSTGTSLVMYQFELGSAGDAGSIRLFEDTLPAAPSSLIQRHSETLAVIDGGLWRVERSEDGGLFRGWVDVGLPVTAGFVSGFVPAAAPVVWGPAGGALLSPDGGQQRFAAPAGATLLDLTFASTVAPYPLVALTNLGVFTLPRQDVANLSDGGWSRVPLLLLDGGDALALEPTRALRSFPGSGGVWPDVAFFSADGGETIGVDKDMNRRWQCPACATGLPIALAQSSSGLNLYCSDGTRLSLVSRALPSCQLTSVVALPLATLSSTGGVLAFGELSGAVRADGFNPMILRAAPAVTVAASDEVVYATLGASFRLDPAFGFVNARHPYDGQLTSSIAGRPTWAWSSIANQPIVDLAPLAADPLTPVAPLALSPASTPAAGSLPRTGAATQLGDGTSLVLVSLQEKLFAARLATDGGPASLESLIDPLQGATVQSLALPTPPADAGFVARAFALSYGACADVRLTGARSWRSELVDLPNGDWVAVKAWKERAFVGYADGRLYSLPGRLQLAGPLAFPIQAQGFEPLQGVPFAATDAGLFQLLDNPDGGAVGVWSPVPLTPWSSDPLAGTVPNPFEVLRLTPGPTTLFATDRQGVTWRITLDGGP